MYKNSLEAKGCRIIFVSSDRDEGSFEGYFAQMPWAALPCANRSKKADLSNKYKVRGIPPLVILNPDGWDAVSGDPQGEAYPWRPPTEEEKATVLGRARRERSATQGDREALCLVFLGALVPTLPGLHTPVGRVLQSGLEG